MVELDRRHAARRGCPREPGRGPRGDRGADAELAGEALARRLTCAAQVMVRPKPPLARIVSQWIRPTGAVGMALRFGERREHEAVLHRGPRGRGIVWRRCWASGGRLVRWRAASADELGRARAAAWLTYFAIMPSVFERSCAPRPTCAAPSALPVRAAQVGVLAGRRSRGSVGRLGSDSDALNASCMTCTTFGSMPLGPTSPIGLRATMLDAGLARGRHVRAGAACALPVKASSTRPLPCFSICAQPPSMTALMWPPTNACSTSAPPLNGTKFRSAPGLLRQPDGRDVAGAAGTRWRRR